MKLEDLEKYRREDGHIDFNGVLEEGQFETLRETRGSQNRDKFWIELEDTKVMLRTSNLSAENVLFSNYAELIVEELAKQVDLPCAHYDLVEYNGQRGIITKNILERTNESIVTAKTLLDQTDTEDDYVLTSSITDLFKSFDNFRKYDDIPKEQVKEARIALGKKAIFESFSMATDSHPDDIILVYYSDGESKSLRMHPLIDNECSLMLDQPEEMIDAMLQNPNLIDTYVELQNPLIVVPDADRDETLPDWQDILAYLCDSSDEFMEFAEKCSEKLDIAKAIESVEARIHCELPDKLKEFVTKVFELRKEKVEQFLDIQREDIELW